MNKVRALFLRLGRDVIPVTNKDGKEGQRRGDLYVSGLGYVEVKGDFTGRDTLFVETEVDGAPGWAFRSRADFLAYYQAHTGKVYLLRFDKLLMFLTEHYAVLRHNTRTTQSRRGTRTWFARGLPVPLESLTSVIERVLQDASRTETHDTEPQRAGTRPAQQV